MTPPHGRLDLFCSLETLAATAPDALAAARALGATPKDERVHRKRPLAYEGGDVMALVRRSLLRAAWRVSAQAGLFFLGLAALSAAGDAVLSAMYDPDRIRWLHSVARVVGGAGAAGLLGVAFLLLAILLRRLLRRVRQREADELGALMVDHLRAGEELTRPFFLYLRAFETTGRLKFPLFAFDLGSFGLQQLRTNELESVIAAALLKKGVLLALGRPGENIGAGRVVSPDEEWVKDIELLAARAKGILVIPSHHPGTVWEIDYLQRHGLLDKTVFLMPPESRRFNWKAHWSQARRGLGSLGSALPEYSELGLLFTIGRDGAVTNAAPFSLFLQRSFRKSILSLLAGKPARRGPIHALARADRRARRQRAWGRLSLGLRGAATLAFIGLIVATRAKVEPNGSPAGSAGPGGGSPTALERLQRSPAYQARVQGLSDEQRVQATGKLISKGFPRLDDTSLAAYFSAFAELLTRADEQTCAAIADGSVTSEQIDRAIDALDAPQRAAFIDAQFAAALAEVEDVEPPRVSPDLAAEARARFQQTLTLEDRARLARLDDPHARATPSELCWALRMRFAAVGVLEEPYRGVWARLQVPTVAGDVE